MPSVGISQLTGTGVAEPGVGETDHPSGTSTSAMGPAGPMALGWRQGSLQAQPGTCMPRPRFLFVAASPSYRRAGALSREAAGCQQSRPDGRWSWPGPGRGCLGKESPQGPGRQKGPPGVVQHPPLPAGAGGKSTPKGTLSSSPDSAAVSYPTGRAAALGRGALAAGLLEGAGGGA